MAEHSDTHFKVAVKVSHAQIEADAAEELP